MRLLFWDSTLDCIQFPMFFHYSVPDLAAALLGFLLLCKWSVEASVVCLKDIFSLHFLSSLKKFPCSLWKRKKFEADPIEYWSRTRSYILCQPLFMLTLNSSITPQLIACQTSLNSYSTKNVTWFRPLSENYEVDHKNHVILFLLKGHKYFTSVEQKLLNITEIYK